ncbi:MAG: peptidylprolyl isomerase [Nanoarchaeota archaeon]
MDNKMERVSKKDFVEIEYTGRIKENNEVFDTTDEKVAKENALEAHTEFGPVIVCVGENQVLKGVDNSLEGREIGAEYTLDIKPGDTFGAKNAKLIQMIPTSKFLQQKIQPMPGMQLNIDGILGRIKTVGGGRTLVDFNHPLAGKELSYKVKINRKIDDKKEQLVGYLKLVLASKDLEVEVDDSNAKIKLKMELTKEAQDELSSKLTLLIPGIKNVEFISEKYQKNK